eukprot:scaffold6_cov245-Pinguiococcus_pyrenoidosus.AAC.10
MISISPSIGQRLLRYPIFCHGSERGCPPHRPAARLGGVTYQMAGHMPHPTGMCSTSRTKRPLLYSVVPSKRTETGFCCARAPMSAGKALAGSFSNASLAHSVRSATAASSSAVSPGVPGRDPSEHRTSLVLPVEAHAGGHVLTDVVLEARRAIRVRPAVEIVVADKIRRRLLRDQHVVGRVQGQLLHLWRHRSVRASAPPAGALPTSSRSSEGITTTTTVMLTARKADKSQRSRVQGRP